jgi:hypothetical protein
MKRVLIFSKVFKVRTSRTGDGVEAREILKGLGGVFVKDICRVDENSVKSHEKGTSRMAGPQETG